MSAKHERKDVRKTIRFDRDMYNIINELAKINGDTFSATVKFTLAATIYTGHGEQLRARISKRDRQLLRQIYVVCSRSSNNLNQATHALNSMKGLSFLDVDPNHIDYKLNDINMSLDKVNWNFAKYQDTLDRFVRHVRKRIY